MSINLKQSVKCPKCEQMTDVIVWSSITVKDSPDLKKDLLLGKINMFRCPDCGTLGIMPHPLLYTDEDRKLMITLSPTNEPQVKEHLYENIKKTSRESGELEKFEGYNLRFVTDYNELIEKVLIFDNDLNDKTIEVLKLMILSQDVDKSEQRTCRFGKLENNVLEFMVHDFIENEMFTSQIPMETYNTVNKSLLDSGMKPYSFDWEIVDGAYATRLLNGFNNNFS